MEINYPPYTITDKMLNLATSIMEKIVSCATGDENKRMQKILKYYDAHEVNLKFYYKKV